jgi:hypothetical protein
MKNNIMNVDDAVIIRVHWATRVLFSAGLLGIALTFAELLLHSSFLQMDILLVEVCVDFGLWKLATSYIEANREYIRVNVFYGTFAIRWTEVTTIITQGAFIAFVGYDKRVVVSLAFAGAGTQKFLKLIQEQADAHRIEIKQLKPSEIMPLTHQNSRE